MSSDPELVVALLGKFSADPPAEVAELWSMLSARIIQHEFVPAGAIATCACHRYSISARGDLGTVRTQLGGLPLPHDVAVLPKSSREFNPRLIAFDLDSTLITAEIIDELARLAGVADQVKQLTEAAMRGDIDFQEAFRRRIALLKGLDEQRCLGLLDEIALTEGAARLIRTLHAGGCKIAVLSGGFSFVSDWLKQKLPIDFALTNQLPITGGQISGEAIEPIVDGAAKAKAFREFAAANKIPLHQTVAVGDGANDLPMMKLAGLSVAFQAKPKVREQANVALLRVGLDGILHLIRSMQLKENAGNRT